MSLFDSPEVKEAKRQYKEDMKRLANEMQPTGKIFLTAKWDDNLGVISCHGTIIKYDTIKNVEVNEKVELITETKGKSKKKHGITRAVVGGVVAGPLGAAVGGMTAKTENDSTSVTRQQVTRTIIVTRDDPYHPILRFGYDQDLELKLRSILEHNQSKPKTITIDAPSSEETNENETKEEKEIETDAISITDEIIKLKKLMDDGILTEEEFTFLKKKLIQK